MGLFSRRKKKPAQPMRQAPSIAGIADDVVATQDFEIVVRKLISQMVPAGTEVVETDHDSIKAGDTETNLGNLRKGWNQRASGERERWLRDALHGMLLSELRDTSTLDTSMLRPGIRSEWYLSAPALAVSAERGEQITLQQATRPLGPGLARVLLWDTPTTMSILSDTQIQDWGSDFDQLWTIAVQNLAGDPVATEGWVRVDDGYWVPAHSDDYTAERLFIDGHLDLTGLDGDVVIFHPNRQTLIVVDPADAAGIEHAAKIALGRLGHPNPITFEPYIGRGMAWRPLSLAEDHPASAVVTQLRLSEYQSSYAQQKELLSAIHGEDVFVATYKAYNINDRVTTMAAWTEGAESLLPKTDLISLVFDLEAPNPQTVLVHWDAATRIIGSHLTPTEHWPQRWHVSSFPCTTEIDQLRTVAL